MVPASKPWPAEALIVVASPAGEEIRSQMEGVHPAPCRECGATVHADTFTVRRANSHPLRLGRPVEFVCLACHVVYDQSTITHAEHHNRPAERAAIAERMAGGGLMPPEPTSPLSAEEAEAWAYRLMCSHLPAGWIEIPDRANPGHTKLSPKAFEFKRALASALEQAYLRGRQLTVDDYRAGKR